MLLPPLLLLLSHVSRVRLCATLQTATHEGPPSLGFSRQEHWSGLPFPSPVQESEVAQSCPTLSDPVDCSLPGSSVHGIFQARALKWGATAFSDNANEKTLVIQTTEIWELAWVSNKLRLLRTAGRNSEREVFSLMFQRPDIFNKYAQFTPRFLNRRRFH